MTLINSWNFFKPNRTELKNKAEPKLKNQTNKELKNQNIGRFLVAHRKKSENFVLKFFECVDRTASRTPIPTPTRYHWVVHILYYVISEGGGGAINWVRLITTTSLVVVIKRTYLKAPPPPRGGGGGFGWWFRNQKDPFFMNFHKNFTKCF
jgi:hypothetical protein